ncbi:MAG: carbohydrate ABC transporter permease [Anaerolineae bacterium]|nr:carbohydrate ABC transporter permease [Anaerolineae bacterium]
MVEKIIGRRWLTHTLLILGALVMVYPLLWMFSSSLKPGNMIFHDPGLIPSVVTLENYIYGWNALSEPFSRFFLNSFFIAVTNVIGTVLTSSATAYAFARLEFRYKRVWFALMMATLLLPTQVTLIPKYIVFYQLGWVDTHFPLIIPAFFATTAFFIFLNVQFVRGIPRELDEAAEIDGATRFQIYWRIILPLSLPALITTAIFNFIWTWDDFFSSLLYLSDIKLYTVPLALRSFSDASSTTSYGPLFAISLVSLVPFLLFFILAQRYLVQGISTTGFKG